MSEDKRPPGSIDSTIENIPLGHARVKIIGTVVSIQPMGFILNDGTEQLTISLGRNATHCVNIGDTGRAIVDTNRDENEITAELLAWNSMERTQIKKYGSLLKIERRIP